MKDGFTYVPMTLKNIADFINKAIRDDPELTGNEMVVGGQFVGDNRYDVPPGSLLLTLKRSAFEEDVLGTLVMMPRGSNIPQ